MGESFYKEPEGAPAKGPEMAAAAAYACSIVSNAKPPLAVLDGNFSVLCASPSFFEVMGSRQASGVPFKLPPAVLAALSQQRGGVLEVEIEAPAQQSHRLRLTLREIEGLRGGKVLVLSVEDAAGEQSLSEELRAAKAEAEQANRLRARILAAANHTLRQPLQTICLVQGMLANSVSDATSRRLIERLDQGVSAMSEMLDKLIQMDREEQARDADEGSAHGGSAHEAPGPARAQDAVPSSMNSGRPCVFIVDDDPNIRETMREMVERHGFSATVFADGLDFLEAIAPGQVGCLIADAKMPGAGGLQIIERLKAMRSELPVVVITAYGDVAMAVRAMKAGAQDFLQKPVRQDELLACIRRAFEAPGGEPVGPEQKDAEAKMQGLTARQRQILDLVLAGAPTKTIAADLNLSQRTVDNHRAAIMRKLGAKSLPSLIRIALAGQGVRDAAIGSDARRARRSL
jgi:FixJ family two-component response regulator